MINGFGNKLELWTPEVGERRSRESGQENLEPSLTVQSQAEDADINVLMKRFGVTGQLPQGMRAPEYGDFMFEGDYRDALHILSRADDAFMGLPPKLRARFENDPAMFMDWFHDPSRTKEDFVAAGLAPDGAVTPPVKPLEPNGPTVVVPSSGGTKPASEGGK